MGIPTKVLDELIGFVDADNCGYIEMPEFVELIQPSSEDLRMPKHDEEDKAEIQRLLSQPPNAEGIPRKEIHPVVNEYLECRDGTKDLMSSIQPLLRECIERRSCRQDFTKNHVFFALRLRLRRHEAIRYESHKINISFCFCIS